MITWIQRKLLFPAHLIPAPPGEPRARGLERWWLDTKQGQVEAWFLPGEGVSAQRPGPALLFAHGNAELVDRFPEQLYPYRRLGISLVLAEYRGYGRSAGQPSERALHDDLCALHRRMASDPRIDMNRLACHGRSLGGGAVCGLARSHTPRALILESTFTSVVDVARGMGIPALFIRDKFESLPLVRSFAGPILVLHGTRDLVVPVSHGKRLAAANPQAKLVLYDAGHNDLPPPGADYWQHIEQTLRSAFRQ
jgi:fermentation-respiration switch protein FrsA (DUF1100 family)